MKKLLIVPVSILDSVVIVRTRGLELSASERTELHRSEAAMGRVFQLIHRIEWKIEALERGASVRCEIRAKSGVFSATSSAARTMAAIRGVVEQILKQKRRAKEIKVTRRRVSPPKTPRSRAAAAKT